MRSKLTYLAAFAVVILAACDNGGPIVPMDNNSGMGMMDEPMMSVVAREAQGWYERAWPEVMAQSGAVMADLDENSGHVTFGVENAGVAKATAAILRAQGVPDNAYTVKLMAPVEQLATLQDRFATLQGGIQIHFTQYLCTLGLPVNTSSGPGFITNSHCTGKQGGVENTIYYQPVSSVDPTVIATEIADPTYGSIAGCPKGRKCRYSDSSLELLSGARPSSVGVITLTTGANNGSLTVAGTQKLTEGGAVSVGTTVNKVGRTTGWTRGNVTAHCAVINVSGGNITQLCQDVVSAGVDHGDSGSPVFNSSNQLVGLLWGGSGTTTFIFSPIAAIKSELGNGISF